MVHGRFAHAEHPDIAGADGAAAEPGQVGHGPVSEHIAAFAGRAGQHDHRVAFRLKGAARRRAPIVVQHGAAFGQPGLFFVVLRHGAVFEMGFDPLQRRLVERLLFAKSRRNGLLGQVIRRGAQAPGGDDDLRPRLGNAQHGLEPLGVVAAHRLEVHVDPQLRQPLGDHGGVGVHRLAQQQFRPHRYDLTFHG